MLLIDRVSIRVTRQSATESAASLFLPLAINEKYPAELQLPVRFSYRARRLLLTKAVVVC